jgi:hypothetical protein
MRSFRILDTYATAMTSVGELEGSCCPHDGIYIFFFKVCVLHKLLSAVSADEEAYSDIEHTDGTNLSVFVFQLP